MMNDILNKLKAPAICLIVVGALNGLISILTLMGGIARFAGIGGGESLPTRDAERFGFYVGTFITYGSGLLALIVAPVIIYGAIQMIKGKKYGFARASAILAIIPFTSCCFLIGVPIGIWALIVLSKPDVRLFFQSGGMNQQQFYPPQPPNNW